jgi:ring-1,2-phenylacetyl-CoA epoxidase subunit PaaD
VVRIDTTSGSRKADVREDTARASDAAHAESQTEEAVWRMLAEVPDPEIPVLSIVDLGIVRYVRHVHGAGSQAAGADVHWPHASDSVVQPENIQRLQESAVISKARPQVGPFVGLTPTYSGCPATDAIRRMVREALDRAGYAGAVIEEVLSPPWSSDWISEEGRAKLREFGIAPPAESVSSPRRLFGPLIIACPRCGSRNTEKLSEFGSTPCKAHYRCTACLEPFDYFKCI